MVSRNRPSIACCASGGTPILGRADRGVPRVLPQADLERYLELIAALKVRTSNGKGRHLSTREAIRVLEDYGWTPPKGGSTPPKGCSRRRRSTRT